jgi:hypothetical protein
MISITGRDAFITVVNRKAAMIKNIGGKNLCIFNAFMAVLEFLI